MSLFTKRKETAVQSFLLKLVNNNCSEMESMVEGPRLEGRVNLVLPVLIVPLEAKRLMAQEAFTAVTKEFSTTGLAVVLDRPHGLNEAVIGFRWEGTMTFVRAKAKHLNPMGGGFYQLGFKMVEMVYGDRYPELKSLSF